MQTSTFSKEGLIVSEINREGESLTVLTVSARVRESHPDAIREVTRLIYAEMLLSGAGALKRDAFMHTLALLGSELTVNADCTGVLISLRARQETLTKTLTLLTTLIEKPLFLPTELIRIKQHLKNALTLAKEDARNRALQAFTAQVYATSDTRYHHTPDELINALSKVTLKELKTLHTRVQQSAWMYTAGGSTGSLTTIQKTLTQFRKKFKTHVDAEKVSIPVIPTQKRILKLHSIPNKQNIEFSIGGSVPILRSSPDYPALVFGMSVLALFGGFAGRLMSIVREKEGLTYNIYGSIDAVTNSEEGYWRIGTFFNPKDAARGITSTIREIKRINQSGITNDELKRFKQILNTRYSLVEDSLLKKVRESHSLKLSDISEEEYDTFKSAIQKVTIKDVSAAVRKYICPDALIISGAGPIDSCKQEIEKAVKQA